MSTVVHELVSKLDITGGICLLFRKECQVTFQGWWGDRRIKLFDLIQQLIDQMFTETKEVLRRYLDPREADALANQLAAARAEG